MARRPNDVPNDALTRTQLKELQRSLSMLSPYDVREKFRAAADRIRFMEIPSPRLMQELVTAWRLLWRWRK